MADQGSTSVDERIVQAKFDSSDFERGVNKTLKKLDELKESLNMNDTSAKITELSEKTKEATENASESIDKLSDRLTTFTGMIKQKLLGGLADEVTDAFFKMKNAVTGFISSMTFGQFGAGRGIYEQMMTSVRMITNAYKRDDKGKIIGNYSVDEAYAAMNKIMTYADETSYSIDQMSDSMSKMVAAGVPLSEAANNVQGIANACANAGVSASEAARAFYNLNQAYSSGSLKYTDYRSLELLNMTNESFNTALMEAAEQVGTLKKIKDGQYKTAKGKGANGGKVTAGKTVNLQTLSESLKYNWVTKDVMNELFGKKFFVDLDSELKVLNDEVKKRLGTDGKPITVEDLLYEEEFNDMSWSEKLEVISDNYGKVAAQAFAAAREARSFTDVMNTWSDIVSAGWGKTWELLFGRLDEAKDFFTELADGGFANSLREIFGKDGYINGVLSQWASTDAKGNNSGQQAFIDTIKLIDELIGKLILAFHSLAPEEHGAGLALTKFSIDVKNAIENFKMWLDEVGPDGISRLDRFVNVFRIFTNALSVGFNLIGVAAHAVGKAFEIITPILDGIALFLGKLAVPIGDLSSNSAAFDALTYSIDNMAKVLQPITSILTPVLDILGDVAAFFLSSTIDTAVMNIQFFSDALGFVMEMLGMKTAQQEDGLGVIQRLTNDVVAFGNECKAAMVSVKDFFTALFADLRTLLGMNTEVSEEGEAEGGIFANIKNFFDTNEFLKRADAWVQQAKIDIENWVKALPQNITNFANQVYQAIFGLFYTRKEKQNLSGDSEVEVSYVQTDLRQKLEDWWNNTKTSIGDFFASIPTKIQDFFNELPNLWQKISEGLFGKVEEESTPDKPAQATQSAKEIPATLGMWLQSVRTGILNFIKSIPDRLKDLGGQIWNAIYSIFYTTEEIDSPHNVTDPKASGNKIVKKTATPFNIWISGIRDTILNFIDSIPEKLSDLGSKIWNAIYSIFYTTEEMNNPSGVGGKITRRVPTKITQWLSKIKKSFTDWYNKLPKYTIQDIIKKIFYSDKQNDDGSITTEKSGFHTFLDDIFGEEAIDKVEAIITDFATRVSTFITNLKTTITSVFNRIGTGISTGNIYGSIKGIFSDLINFIASIFSGSTDIETNAEWFAQTVANGISWIKEKVEAVWPAVKDFLISIPNRILGIFKGTDSEIDSEDPVNAEISGSISDLGTTIGEAIASLPEIIVKFIDNAITSIDELWSRLYDSLTGNNKLVITDDKLNESVNNYQRYFTSGKWLQMDPEDVTKKMNPSKWDEFAESFGQMISNAIATIPKWIANGVDLAIKGIDWAIGQLTGLLNSGLSEAVDDASGGGGKSLVEQIDENLADNLDEENTEENSSLVKSLANIGQSLITLITSTIPEFVAAGFRQLRTNVDMWLKPLRDAFEEMKRQIPTDATLTEKIKAIGDFIGMKVEKLIPEPIKTGFDNLKNNVSTWWNSLDTLFKGWSMSDSELKQDLGNIGLTIKGFVDDLGRTITEAFDSLARNFKVANASPDELLTDSINNYQRFFVAGDKSAEKLLTGPSLFDKIVTAIIEGFNAIGSGVGGWWDSVKQIFDDLGKVLDSADYTWFEKLGAIGTAIGDIIKSFIPESIKTGFNDVKRNAGEWWASLDGIFDEWSGSDSALKQKVAVIGRTIKGFIDDIGPVVTKAFRDLSRSLGNRDLRLNDAVNNYQRFFVAGDKTAEDLLNKSNKTLFETVVDSIDTFMQQIGEYAKKAFGIILPYIIDGFTSFITTVGSLFSKIGDLITGKTSFEDILKEVFGDEAGSSVYSSLDEFKNKIVEFFSETLPKSIEEIKLAVEEKGGLGNLFGGIFDGLFPKADAEEVKDEAVKSAEQVNETLSESEKLYRNLFGKKIVTDATGRYIGDARTESVLNKLSPEDRAGLFAQVKTDATGKKVDNDNDDESFLDKISNLLNWGAEHGSTIATVALAIVLFKKISELLSTIRDTLTITDETDAAAKFIKWTGITTAITAVAGILGYITYLASIDTDGTKIKKIQETFTTAADFIKTIATSIGTLMGLNVTGKIFDWLSGKEAAKAAIGEAAPSFWSKAGSSVLGAVGSFFSSFATMTGIGLGAELTANGVSASIQTLMDTVSDIGRIIDNFVTALDTPINNLIELQNKLEQAQGIAYKLTSLFKSFEEIFIDTDDLFNFDSENIRQSAWETVSEDGVPNTMANLWYFNKEKVAECITAVGNFLSGFTIAVRNIDSIEDPTAAAQKLADLFENNSSVQSVMTNVANMMREGFGLTDFAGDDDKRFQNTITALDTFGSAMGIFTNSLISMTPENVAALDNTLLVLEKIVSVSEGIGEKTDILQQLSTGADSHFSRAGRTISDFGSHMKLFFDRISEIRNVRGTEIKDIENFDATTRLAIDALIGISDAVGKASLAGDFFNNYDWVSSFASKLPELGTKLAEFISSYKTSMTVSTDDINMDLLTTVSSMVSSISELFKTPFGQITNTIDFDAYKEQFFEKIRLFISELQRAIDNPGNEDMSLKIHITPIVDMDKLTAEFNETLGVTGEGFDGFQIKIPENLYTTISETKPIDYTNSLNTISDDVSTFHQDIVDLKEYISNLKISINGDTLVGEIMTEVKARLNFMDWLNSKGIKIP